MDRGKTRYMERIDRRDGVRQGKDLRLITFNRYLADLKLLSLTSISSLQCTRALKERERLRENVDV